MNKIRYKKIIAVITHAGNRDRADAIKKTWLSKPLPKDYLFLFVHGNDGGKVPRIEGDKIFLPAKESWENLPNKMYDFYEYCVAQFDFDYLFKIDDDVCFQQKWLKKYPIQKIDYAGLMQYPAKRKSREKNDHNVRKHGLAHEYRGRRPAFFASGAFYVLSYKVVKAIVAQPKSAHEDCQMDAGYEDHMIAKAFIEESQKQPLLSEDWNLMGPRKYFFYPYYFTDLSASQILHHYSFFTGLILKQIFLNTLNELKKAFFKLGLFL